MLYATLTLWLLVIVFSAWGVHALWSGLIRPRIVNSILLPGTLIAQLGHVLGVLVTGNSVQNTALMGEDEDGAPQAEPPESPRMSIVSAIVIGLLPLAACAAGLFWASTTWGREVLVGLAAPAASLPQELPRSLTAFWDLLRTCVSAVEAVLNAVLSANLTQWTTVAFLYLAVCLTVRMTPFEGNRRGAIAAILLFCVLVGLTASFVPALEAAVLKSWPILSFAVAVLLLLLFASSAVAGLVHLLRILAKNE